MNGPGWREIAAILAEAPCLVDNLLAAHTPSPAGRCTGCHTAGTGTPGGPWPCSLHTLAVQAERIRAARAGHQGRRPG